MNLFKMLKSCPLLLCITFFVLIPISNIQAQRPDTIIYKPDTNSQMRMQNIPLRGTPSMVPNPAEDIASLSFFLYEDEVLTISIINIHGQEVFRPFSNSSIKAGNHTVKFDVRHLAAGIYFTRISTRKTEDVTKWIKN